MNEIEVRAVGRGTISEPERTAVQWVVARTRGRDSVPPAWGANRIFVRRASSRPYDLLLWDQPATPGDGWCDAPSGRRLVDLCLREFASAGLVPARKQGSAYRNFADVVHRHQTAAGLDTAQRSPPSGQQREYIGWAYIDSADRTFPAEVKRAVLRPDGMLLELAGQLFDGSHYRTECNLERDGDGFKGRARTVYLESKETSDADIALRPTFSRGNEVEFAGHWVEPAPGEGDVTLTFELELRVPV